MREQKGSLYQPRYPIHFTQRITRINDSRPSETKGIHSIKWLQEDGVWSQCLSCWNANGWMAEANKNRNSLKWCFDYIHTLYNATETVEDLDDDRCLTSWRPRFRFYSYLHGTRPSVVYVVPFIGSRLGESPLVLPLLRDFVVFRELWSTSPERSIVQTPTQPCTQLS